MLYEMATGQQAFSSATTAVSHDAILNRAPLPVTSVNPPLPPKLEEIINKALEKGRDLRYQRSSVECQRGWKAAGDAEIDLSSAGLPERTHRRRRAPESASPPEQ